MLAIGWEGVGGPAGAKPPRASWVRSHTAGRRPRARESAAYARRSRHPPTFLYAKRSQQRGSWAGGPGGTPGGLVMSPAITSFPQAGPACRAAIGRRPDRLGRGSDRPVEALRARKKGEDHGRGPEKGRRREKEDERGVARERRARRPETARLRARLLHGSARLCSRTPAREQRFESKTSPRDRQTPEPVHGSARAGPASARSRGAFARRRGEPRGLVRGEERGGGGDHGR